MAFNKMMIMLPLMFAARKLDGTDPNIIFLLRCSYFTVQTFIVLAVIYIFMTARKIAAHPKLKDVVIYVAPPASPFADPNAKKQYKQITYGEQATAAARQLLSSTLMGILMTTGLHWYKGMIVGLAMQSVMGPLNLLENKLAKGILLGGNIFASGSTSSEEDKSKSHTTDNVKSKRLFDEKYRDELTKEDEVVDAEGKILILSKKDALKDSHKMTTSKDSSGMISAEDKKKSTSSSLEDLILDTWDEGDKANIQPLLQALNQSNVNFTTSENLWTPLMILAALGAPGCENAIDTLNQMGVNASMVDAEGWNALHWAAFHGSASGAAKILKVFGNLQLDQVVDKEGKTPLQHAKDEKNEDVVKVLMSSSSSSSSSVGMGLADQGEGVRQRGGNNTK